jgi:hypothetical protein
MSIHRPIVSVILFTELNFLFGILFVALDGRLSSTATWVSEEASLLLAFFANCVAIYSGQLENLC